MPGDEVALTVARSIIIGLFVRPALLAVVLVVVALSVVVLDVDEATGASGDTLTACTGPGVATAAVRARGTV